MDRYRLGPVRDARERGVEVARGSLADRAAESRAAGAVVEAIRARIAGVTEAIARAGAPSVQRASKAVRQGAWVARLRRDLAVLGGELARAEAVRDGRVDEVDAARRELGQARAAREVIERHFERWREDRKRLAERREE